MIGVYHGGDLASATREFGCPTDGWLDLSTGVNPLPWLVPSRMLESLHCLPDSEQIEILNSAAAEAYGVEETGRIACGPGSQALIQWLPRLRDKCRVAVITPTYGEHAHAWRAAGHNVFETSSMPNAGECEIAVLTRPNNPDGASIEIDAVASLAADLEKRGFVLVDEAFADLDPVSSICAGGWAGIIALRSFGKVLRSPGPATGLRHRRLRDYRIVKVCARTMAGVFAGGNGRRRCSSRQDLADRNPQPIGALVGPVG